MAIRLYNDGNTVRYDKEGEELFNFPKPYEVSLSKDKKRVSIRTNIGSVFFNYSEVVSPATSNAEELRALLISWMSGTNAGQTSISYSNSDIAGQVIVGNPTPTGDYRFTNNLNTRYFHSKTNGTGSVTRFS